jgi:hypothetical protein
MFTRQLREPRNWGTGAGWMVWSSTSSVDCMFFEAWACVDFAQRVACYLLAVIWFCVPPNRGVHWALSLVILQDESRQPVINVLAQRIEDEEPLCRPTSRQKGANEAQRPRVIPLDVYHNLSRIPYAAQPADIDSRVPISTVICLVYRKKLRKLGVLTIVFIIVSKSGVIHC